MDFPQRFLRNTDRALKRQENRYYNLIDTIRNLVEDGYLDNEEGFTFDDLREFLRVKTEVGRCIVPSEDADLSVDIPSPNGIVVTGDRHIEEIRPVLDALVEKGVLVVEGDKYKMTDEKWEALSFPSHDDE